MVQINVSGFANKIKEYLEMPSKFSEKDVESTLMLDYFEVLGSNKKGIRFGYNTRLMMDLFSRAYKGLPVSVDAHSFSQSIASAVDCFARPFPEGDNLCYPHFIFHGLLQPSLEKIVTKIQTNARVIHETQACKTSVKKEYDISEVSEELRLSLVNGNTDDMFGISLQLWRLKDFFPLAKCGFFLDMSEKDIYVLNVQGKKFRKGELTEEEYGRIGNILGMSPRRFVLENLCKYGRNHSFKRIRIVHPTEHPMFIEHHEGFNASYESTIIRARIDKKNDCYLETTL